MTTTHGHRTGGRLVVLAVLLGLLGSGVLVWQSSRAAFTATTSNDTNSWAAGTVSVSDDDSGSAMFTATGLAPGDTASRCVTVTYTGSLASSVKLYTTASSYSGTLGSYLSLVVEQGTGGSFADCAGFTSSSTVYSGTLANFASSATGFGTGVGAFAPTGAGQSSVYRFTYTLADDNAAQGTSGGIGFTWEAQNT